MKDVFFSQDWREFAKQEPPIERTILLWGPSYYEPVAGYLCEWGKLRRRDEFGSRLYDMTHWKFLPPVPPVVDPRNAVLACAKEFFTAVLITRGADVSEGDFFRYETAREELHAALIELNKYEAAQPKPI